MASNKKYTKKVMGNFIKKVPDIISGAKPPRTSDERKLYNVFWSTLTQSLFESIYKSYKARSEGGADDRGMTWQDLAPVTKAYKKNRKGHLTGNQRRKLNNQDTLGLLTPAQHKEWKYVFGKTYGKLKPMAGENEDDIKALAAKKAWYVVKQMGAETLIGTLGNAQMPIMKETGLLLDSLKPGKVSKVKYIKGHRNQVVRLRAGELEIGTNVPYAKYAARTIVPWTRGNNVKPQYSRDFLDDPTNKWFDKAVAKARDALAKEMQQILTK